MPSDDPGARRTKRRRLDIAIITPAPRGSRLGNRVTALRWARLLADLGHRVDVQDLFDGRHRDVLIAVHARRSFDAARRFHREHPEGALVVALSGTDLYRDVARSANARRALEWADRLVVLQPAAVDALAPALRPKAHVILQSAKRSRARIRRRTRSFDVCVVGHLRAVKDPFRAALAVRALPTSSRLRVVHLGRALEPSFGERANAEMERNPRYVWLGERPGWQVRQIVARSRALVLTSRMEGGANAISEAIVARTPVIASRIPGSIGMLGADYPGFFPLGDTAALTATLARFESDRAFRRDLSDRARRLAPSFTPAAERRALRELLDALPAR